METSIKPACVEAGFDVRQFDAPCERLEITGGRMTQNR
jgi:hypothetical protein